MNDTIALASGMTLYDAVMPGLIIGGGLWLLLPRLRPDFPPARIGIILLSVFLMWRYMIWRITETLPPVGYTLEFGIGIVFLVIEVLSVISATLAMLWMTRTRSRRKDADKGVRRLRRDGAAPLIDVFICTYNEEREVLLPTMLAAMNIAYDNKRVWVLDDGRRSWLQTLCEQTDCGYITRSDNEHAKAGNINNALGHVAQLDDQPEYVAILDADFMSEPALLERTLALMHYDKSVALVQTPQHFVNPDPIQRNLSMVHIWPDEQRYFFDVVLTNKDAWNLAFCCGTSSLIRFSALREIGGLPTSSVTEDYLLSVVFRERGYQTVYLNERLSVGLAPEGLAEYLTQRGRWALGLVQIFRGSHGPFSARSKVSWLERLSLIDTFLYWGAVHAFRVMAIIVPAIYLLFDIKSVHAGLYDAMSHLFPFLLVIVVANGWLTQWRVMPIMSDVSQLLSAHTVLKSVAIGLFRPRNQRFKVTVKGGDRSQRFIMWPLLKIYLGYLALTVAAVLWPFLINNSAGLEDSSIMALFWCWYNLAVLVMACTVCIEDPSHDVREPADGELCLDHAGEVAHCRTIDVSLASVRLKGPCPFRERSVVGVSLDGAEVPGWITQVKPDDFVVKFVSCTGKIKQKLLEPTSVSVETSYLRFSAYPVFVAGAVINRILR
ncbi:MAG: glycosyltransferase [Hyphomicrobiaceae bacterium]|nr:glycosyltransferase [Hyphomicrobiaceae bacterium]MCC0011272.1 glycosyltransferase [Hyphomicrobiaceae bacterium]